MIILLLICFGLIFGSFINAWVWRLHEQLDADGNPKKLSKKRQAELSISKGRSMCPHCGHELAAKDLLPVVSWLLLRGKCRYCKKPISKQYPLIELLVAVLFVVSYLSWPQDLTSSWHWLAFITWLGVIVGFVALAIYDSKWLLLPDKIITPLVVLVYTSILAQFALGRPLQDSIGIVGGVAVCAGFFWLLYRFSGGKWIGGGDVKLGLITGAVIGSAVGGMLYLFCASMLGLLWVLPHYVQSRRKAAFMKQAVPFGPFLIAACILVVLYGQAVTSWYLTSFSA